MVVGDWEMNRKTSSERQKKNSARKLRINLKKFQDLPASRDVLSAINGGARLISPTNTPLTTERRNR